MLASCGASEIKVSHSVCLMMFDVCFECECCWLSAVFFSAQREVLFPAFYFFCPSSPKFGKLHFTFFFFFFTFLFSASDSRSLRWHVLNHLAISSQEALAGWWCGSRRPSSTVAHSGTKSLKFGVTDQEESSFRNFCTRIRDIKLLTSHNGAGRPEHPTVSLC